MGLSEVLGAAPAKFRVLRDANNNAIDISSSRGALFSKQPPSFRFALDRASDILKTQGAVLVAAMDDDQILNCLDSGTFSDGELLREDGEELRDCAAADSAELTQRLLERILEYQQIALETTGSLDACLAGMNAGLMAMATQLGTLLNGELNRNSMSIARYSELVPATDAYLRLLRQIDRFSQLETRMREWRSSRGPLGMASDIEAYSRYFGDRKRRK